MIYERYNPGELQSSSSGDGGEDADAVKLEDGETTAVAAETPSADGGGGDGSLLELGMRVKVSSGVEQHELSTGQVTKLGYGWIDVKLDSGRIVGVRHGSLEREDGQPVRLRGRGEHADPRKAQTVFQGPGGRSERQPQKVGKQCFASTCATFPRPLNVSLCSCPSLPYDTRRLTPGHRHSGVPGLVAPTTAKTGEVSPRTFQATNAGPR